MQSVRGRDMLLKMEKVLPMFGAYLIVVWWVKPHNVPFPCTLDLIIIVPGLIF